MPSNDAVPPAPQPAAPVAGWYPDPQTPGMIRYWDGAAWGASAPAQPPAAYVPPASDTWTGTRNGVGPGEALKLAVTRVGDYRGRSSRSEYWWAWLFLGLVGTALVVAINVAFPGELDARGEYQFSDMGALLSLFVYIPLMVVGLPLAIRRLHDSGKAWPFLLLGLVPFGGIVMLVFMCLGTEMRVNNWGPPPK